MEELNLIYLFDMHKVELTKDKMQCIDTATTVWLGGPIPEQFALEIIDQTLLESKEFARSYINQVEMITKGIILHTGKQEWGGGAIHVIVPEGEKS